MKVGLKLNASWSASLRCYTGLLCTHYQLVGSAVALSLL